jgi:phosphoribosylglycinamide formyltransferase-1
MAEEFVSEAIKPVAGTFDPAGMVRGEPGLPRRFVWRDQEYTVATVLGTWKEDGPCKHGSGEMYLRKHWFKILTEQGTQMTIYFERQARSKRQSKTRWWLYTINREHRLG